MRKISTGFIYFFGALGGLLFGLTQVLFQEQYYLFKNNLILVHGSKDLL